MRINWGYKIVLLYTGFVGLVVTMVTLSMKEEVNLVSKDYYAQELAYQDHIDRVEQTKALAEQLTWKVSSDSIILRFPQQFRDSKVIGKILFFRPSGGENDRELQLQYNGSGMYVINTSHMKEGSYIMKIWWEENKAFYYNEGVVYINR